jgi:hypothetical protein
MQPKNGHDVQPFNLPPWLAAMRAAVQEAITPEDIKAMVKAQVEKAKAGDPAAMKIVFDQFLGGAALKGATFIQKNVTVHKVADQPDSQSTPGSEERIRTMSRRASAGLPVKNGRDRGFGSEE